MSSYLEISDNGTTITVECSDDTITFADTANAILMEATPLRAWITDDNGDWYIYDTMMFHYGTATTGMSGNDNSAHTISGDWDWYALNSTNETANAAITASLQDTTMAEPTLGTEVTDLNIPDHIADGICNDGARHFDPDSNEKVKFIFDRTRYNQPVVIHEQGFRTGTAASPTEHLIEYFRFDDDAASATISADTGNDASWEDSSGTERNTSNDTESTGTGQDSGLDTKGTYHAELVTTVYTNAVFKQGAVIIKGTPQFGYNNAADQTIFNLYVDSDDYIQLVYDAGNNRYELRVSWGGTLTTLNGNAYTESTSLQQLTTFHAAWDSETNMLMLAINGQVVDIGTNTGTPSTSGAAYVCVGANSDGDGTTSLNADIVLDNYKAFNAAVLIFGGGPFLTNDGSDYSKAHGDVTFHDKTNSVTNGYTPAIGIGTVGVSGSPTLGTGPDGISNTAILLNASTEYLSINSSNLEFGDWSISFWFKITSEAYNSMFVCCDAGYAEFSLFKSASTNQINARYNATALFGTVVSADIGDGNWHYLRYTGHHDGTYLNYNVYVDGLLEITGSSIISLQTSYGNYIFFGDDGSDIVNAYISKITITDDPDTPDQWSAMGAPRLLPLLEVTE